MGTLYDLYVRVLGDKSDVDKTIRQVRADGERLGREKFNFKVGADTKQADAQVKALKSTLSELQRKTVNIPIRASRIDADIEQTKRRLAELKRERIQVPIGVDTAKLDAEIRKTELALTRLDRRKIDVPVSLERASIEIASVEAQLARLEHKRIRIPIIADLDAKSIQQTSQQIAGLLKFPALAASAGPVIGSLAAVSAGLFSVGAAAAPAFGALAAGGGALLALGQGAGVAAFALAGVGDALKAVNAVNTTTAAGYEPTDKQIQKVAETYGLTGKAAQGFVKQLLHSSDALGKVRKATQDEIFPTLTESLQRLTKTLLPTFASGAQGTAIALGVLAKEGTDMVTSGPWRRDFATIMEANTRNISVFGGAGLDVADMLRNLLVAVQPLTARFADFVAHVAAGGKAFVQTERDSGGLTRFFKHAGDMAAQLGRIFGNLIVSLFNVGKAAQGSGEGLITSFEKATKKLRILTGSVEGQNKLRAYFENAADVAREAGRLFNDVGLAVLRMGGNSSLAPLIKQIRTQLVPAVERLLGGMGGSFGPQFINLLTTLTGTFERLTAGGGSLSGFVGTLEAMARALNHVLDSPLGPVVSKVLTLAGSAAAIGLVAGQFGRVASAIQTVGGPMFAFGKSLVTGAAQAGSLASKLGGVARTIIVTGAQWLIATGRVIAHTAALVANKAIQIAVTVATKAWAAGQWLLNAALTANPIGLVVVAIGALVGGLIYAYKHSEKFRAVVQAAWRGIQVAAQFAWEKILKPIFSFFGSVISKVGEKFFGFGQMIGRVWDRIRGAFMSGIRIVVGVYLGFVSAVVRGAAKAFGWIPGIGGKLKHAADDFERFKNDVNRRLGGINDKTVRVGVKLSADAKSAIAAFGNRAVISNGKLTGIKYPGGTQRLATGGPVGSGYGSRDDVPALLTRGEHVLTTREVKAAGGHAGVEAIREDLRNRQRYATGGAVGIATDFPDNSQRRRMASLLSRTRDRVAQGVLSGLSQGVAAAVSATSAGAADPSGAYTFPLPRGSYRVGVPLNGYAGHTGQDFPVASGTPTFAPFAGMLTTKALGNRSYGNMASITAGSMRYIAGHLQGFARGNGPVARGDLLGWTDSTGNSTGPHLHAEFRRNGRVINPRSVLSYDRGGLLYPGQLGGNFGPRGGSPERVLTPKQNDSFERAIPILERIADNGGGGGTLVQNITLPNRRTAIEVGRAANRALEYGWSG